MSSKSSIILTEDNEHWYDECNERDNGHFRVYIEIDNKNIESMDILEPNDDIVIGIRGDSELAQMIKLMRHIKKDKNND